MILYVDNDRRIIGFNKILTKEREKEEVAKSGAIIFEDDFNFEIGEDIEGKTKEFYLNEDGTIRIEYVDIELQEESLTEQEQITIDTALTVEYIACLLEANLG